MSLSPFIEIGKIYSYRLFDIGKEIDLSLAKVILEKNSRVQPFKLRRNKRSLVIAEKPVVISLTPWPCDILGETYEVQTKATLWSFGAMSVQFAMDIKPGPIEKLIDVSVYLENDQDFHLEAVKRAQMLVDALSDAIEHPKLWEDYEDYVIFSIERAQGLSNLLKDGLISDDLVSLVLAEKSMPFAAQTKEALAKNLYQYGRDDAVLLHWNGAVIFDLKDAEDIADTLEFAISQLLELRYYDTLLDGQLQTLYRRIERSEANIFRNPYRELAQKAAVEYIDTSEIVDRVNNSLKIIGDFYYANIYRAATQCFRIRDWRASVDFKLNHLAEVCKLFQGEVYERRNLIMEGIIVILIAIELIPLALRLF